MEFTLMLKSKKFLLTQDQYDLIVYCLENQWLDFNPQEEMDASIVIDVLKDVTEFVPPDKAAHVHHRTDLDTL